MVFMNCPNCGTPNDARSTFCGRCGYALQATEAATSSPQLKGESSPPPSSYPGGNMPSSPNYPAGGSPPPPTFYPAGNVPSSFTYPASGSPPPPPYPAGSMPSSPTYQASGSGFPPATYPKSEASVPPPQPQRPRRGKGGIFVILFVAVVVILAGAVFAGYFYITHRAPTVTSTSSTPTQSITATATSAPSTPTQSTTATATSTSSTPTQSTTATATTPPASSSNYSATQPGPGCDTNGGTWTPQGISNITCGTQISVNANTRGYLYLQLPNNTAFSSNNSIGITGNVAGNNCVGLAELDANTGYLAEYCANGQWYIYSISSTGAIVKTLSQSITSTRASEQLLLTFSGTTLSFSIDNEVHKINISPIQPTKVAVTLNAVVYNGSVMITNFSYTTTA